MIQLSVALEKLPIPLFMKGGVPKNQSSETLKLGENPFPVMKIESYCLVCCVTLCYLLIGVVVHLN
jgi:hypothetical protein